MPHILETSIEFLKGVGPQRAELLRNELGIYNYQDLLEHYPYRYIDRSSYTSVLDLPNAENHVQVKGWIESIKEVGVGRAKKLLARFRDKTGAIDLIWFQGGNWIKAQLQVNVAYQLFGKPKLYGNSWNIPHPELTPLAEVQRHTGFQPLYPSTEKLSAKGLHSRGLEKLIHTLLQQIVGKIEDPFAHWMIQSHKFVGKEEAVFRIHQPNNLREIEGARFRLKFEEMFFLQLELLIKKGKNEKESKGHVFETTGEFFNEFYSLHMPFELTNAQKRVIKEIRKDLGSGKHMNRLVQGDVGSGKTLVALLCMLIANGNGFQAALMAPTEILAIQHYEGIKALLGGLSVGIHLLTGSTKKSDRNIIHKALENGTCQLLIGTHALLEDPVQFHNLGLVVIDEQHRFGVAQRARMRAKNAIAPHILIMTATPIPRTLAMTFYGDLDVSVIDELPPGRKPISTIHRYESHRLALLGFMKKEIDKGRQVYVVFPLIKESESMDFHNLMDGFEAISRYFPMPHYQVSIVHGKLKPEVKDYEMQRFVRGETHIMVATTVIEVGVNVPNASVMVIESAERFGLSQLHQLRGRVGRGAEKSYCILMTGDALSKESKKRMDTMVETQDGFEISEVDLQLRGPGDLMGTQQSGALQFKIVNLAKDGQIIQLARNTVQELIAKDYALELAEHQRIKIVLHSLLANKPNWGKIA